MTMTTTETANTPTDTTPPRLQMGELVLKTGRFEQMRAWYTHVLGHGPFFERTPDPDAPPRPAGMPERAVDVRLAFFEVFDGGHPHHQVLAIFGVDSLRGVEPQGPGLHHFQFSLDSLGDVIAMYDHMTAFGVQPYRAANHGQATSYYYNDPDGNAIEFTTSNMATFEDEAEFMAGPVFAANPSGVEHDPADFARRFHSGEPRDTLLSLDPAIAKGLSR